LKQNQPSKTLVASDAWMTSAAIQLQMLPGLNDFLHLSDVTFSVDIQIFKLHRAILMARCKFFEGMLTHNFKEKENKVIELNSMSAPVFRKVVEYLYTGRVENLPPDLCMEVLVASNLLGLRRLTQICEKAIQPLLEEENVVAVCQAAEFHNAIELIDACIHVMSKIYPAISIQPEFEQLSEKTKDTLKVEREKFVKNFEEWKEKKEKEIAMQCIFYES